MKVIQFSPVRSGSTLVYNIIRKILHHSTEIVKTHSLKTILEGSTVISTKRHPLDILCSSMLRYDLPFNEKNIVKQVKEIKKQGLTRLIQVKNHKDVHVLKYEDFYKNHNVIFDQLERIFSIEITKDLRANVSNEVSILKAKKISDQYLNFHKYDKKTQIHGKHISEYLGTPETYKIHLSEATLRHKAYSLLQNEIIKLGYE